MSDERNGVTATRPDFGPPYNNFYGAEYEKFPTVKEVAAAVRSDLKALTKDAASPLFGAKVSVRYKSFSGGCSIDTKVESPNHVLHNFDIYDMNEAVCTVCATPARKARTEVEYDRKYWLTKQGLAIHDLAKSMLNAHNHDRSDIQTDYFDVRFYGEVEVRDMEVTA